MKPFNLKEALAGKPVVTRGGKKIIIASFNFNAKGIYDKLLGWNEDGEVMAWNENGIFSTVGSGLNDLVMASEKKEGWVNIYSYNDSPSGFKAELIHNTKEDALEFGISGKNYITTVKIEWEE